MLPIVKRLAWRSPTLVIGGTILTVMTVGAVDYAATPDISLSVFYLFAIGVGTWFMGRRYGWFVAFLSIVVSLAGDFLLHPRDATRFAPVWNASIVLALYLVVVGLVSRLRALHDDLEARVEQRTADLRSEMAERERLERELLDISEREQRRIGHDLHDSLGQHLTGTALAGQVLAENLGARNAPETADAHRLVDLVEKGIALSRNLAKGLHPIQLEAVGLMDALEELAAVTSDLFKIECRFECDSPVLIRDPAVSMHLYRIAQEAVSNAVKHGRARQVAIQLENLDDGIALRVKDDGIGLPPEPSKRGGMGLRIMAHRASMFGARFAAERAPSQGTVVTCVLQLEPRPVPAC